MAELWQSRAVRVAVAAGDAGTLIRLARQSRGMTQRQLGQVCGYSQPVISRIERGERAARDIRLLAHLARELDIPAQLLGLAEPTESPVNRREFLASGAAVATVASIPPLTWPLEPGTDLVTGLRSVTSAYRRLDAVLPSRDLAGSVTAQMTMSLRLLERAADSSDRARLAESASETAGLAAWLAWDGSDLGSARGHYATAIKTARRSGNRLLGAYMTGSLASLVIDLSHAAEGLGLLRSARAQLGAERPAIADAWLSCLDALAHAAAGEDRPCWTALDRAEAATARIVLEEAPPWPWMFAFDHTKVAASRLTCAARLSQPHAGLAAAADASPRLTGGHARQRALLAFDLADVYLQAGLTEEAFAVAGTALDVAAPFASGRVADRARRFRRVAQGRVPAAITHSFYERLRVMAI